MPASLGAALGLIDPKYALAALEEDALGPAAIDRYATQGVPTLDASDIKLAPGEDFSMPVDQWIAQRGQTKAGLATPYYAYPINMSTSLLPRNGLPQGVRSYSVRFVIP